MSSGPFFNLQNTLFMARTRIVIGHTADTTSIVYQGRSGSESIAAMEQNTSAQRFEIFEGPGRFKNNSRLAAVKADVATDTEVEEKAKLEAEKKGKNKKAKTE